LVRLWLDVTQVPIAPPCTIQRRRTRFTDWHGGGRFVGWHSGRRFTNRRGGRADDCVGRKASPPRKLLREQAAHKWPLISASAGGRPLETGTFTTV
jgi:hypothetical protein